MNQSALAKELRAAFPALPLKENEPMAAHCSFRIGGPAEVFAEPDSEACLCALWRWLRERNVPVTVIGNGTNLLVHDEGVRGAVLHLGEGFSELRREGDRLYAAAGVTLARLAMAAKDAGMNAHVAKPIDTAKLMETLAEVLRGDARSFALDERFDVVLLACNFLNHFPDARDVLAVLRRCREHLLPRGCVIIDCSAPDTEYMVKSNGKEEALTFMTGSGSEIRDYFLPRYDLLNQIEEDTIRLEEWREGKLLRSACTEEKLTWYYPRELRSLIDEAGLRVRWESDRLSIDGSSHPILPDACNMVFCCEWSDR